LDHVGRAARFAHGFVAYLGGDYTIKERGGLTLNPLQYIDPLTSLVLPVVFLLMGAMPLAGGVTYVRRDLLRSRKWDFAVSAAGPAMNFILFILLSLPFHPALRWIDPSVPVSDYKPWQIFCAGMAQVQMLAVVMNLLPLPPLGRVPDARRGMDEVQRQKFMTPPVPMIGMIVYFAIFSARTRHTT
jgi:Zn-dependent protease